jgi:GTP cyclohydrolase I
MTDEQRVKEFVLPTANSSVALTDEQQSIVIENAAKAYEAFLDALGFDWRKDPNSDNTPHRVAKSFVKDLIAGCYNAPPKVTSFPSDGYDGIVAQTNIPVKSLCSHHHLAFTGRAHVAYIPSLEGRVIGLSKLNRIVEYYARRPQVQESLTMQIANAINDVCELNKGVAVVVKAQHTCACLRGVKHDGCWMITSKLMGDFMDDVKCRKEFYDFIEMAEK